jgi:putative Mg2+ transporter-C (MgtC) family protein
VRSIFPASAEKILAGVVTGVGFLGAGLIFGRDSGGVHGLTTAASLWATSAVGVLFGAGEYFVGIAACVLLLFVLEFEKLPGMSSIDAEVVRRRRARGATHGSGDPPPAGL